MSVQQIIKIVYNEFNLKYSGADAPQNDSVVDFWADISKIETEIGWKRKYTLENGLLATIGWWRKHLESSEETQ